MLRSLTKQRQAIATTLEKVAGRLNEVETPGLMFPPEQPQCYPTGVEGVNPKLYWGRQHCVGNGRCLRHLAGRLKAMSETPGPVVVLHFEVEVLPGFGERSQGESRRAV